MTVAFMWATLLIMLIGCILLMVSTTLGAVVLVMDVVFLVIGLLVGAMRHITTL